MKQIFKEQKHKYCGGTIKLFRGKEGYVFICDKCKGRWDIGVNGVDAESIICKEWRDIKKSEMN